MINEKLKHELEQLILADGLQVGQTFRLMKSGIDSPKEIVSHGVGANTGVVGTNKVIIKSILENHIPNSSYISRYAYRAINRLRENTPESSPELEIYLDQLQTKLDQRAKSSEAAIQDAVIAVESTQFLSKRLDELKNQSGVYVYSFPTYLKHGTDGNAELKLLKIGRTENDVWQRLISQNRQTSMPEDPVLLRIYYSDSLSTEEIEANFHMTLDAFGHSRSAATSTKAGREWFATTLEALDAVASLMNLKIEQI